MDGCNEALSLELVLTVCVELLEKVNVEDLDTLAVDPVERDDVGEALPL